VDQGNDAGVIDKPSKGKIRHRWVLPYLLKGKLRTHTGHAMSPTSVHRPAKKNGVTEANTSKDKPMNTKRLVPYYVSQLAIKEGYKNCEIKSLNAQRLDQLVRGLVGQALLKYDDSDADRVYAHLNQNPITRY